MGFIALRVSGAQWGSVELTGCQWGLVVDRYAVYIHPHEMLISKCSVFRYSKLAIFHRNNHEK